MANLRGLRLARARPKTGGGGGIAFPTIAVGAPSAVSAASPFQPFDTGSTAHSIFYTSNGGIRFYLNRDDATSPVEGPNNALKVTISPTVWALAAVRDGVQQNSNFNNVAFTNPPPAGTPCVISRNANGSITVTRLDTNQVMGTISAATIKGNFGVAFDGGTCVSAAGGGTQFSAQGNAVPLTINSYTLDTAFKPSLDMSYTGAGKTGYRLEPRTVGGTVAGPKVDATVTVLDPGHLRLDGPSNFFGPDLYGANVLIRVYELVNGVESGVFRDSIPYIMPAAAPRPLRVGANLAGLYTRYEPFTSFQDHFIGGDWRTTGTNAAPPASWLDASGFPADPAGAGGSDKLFRRFHQPAEACTMEISWTQNTATDAVWGRGVSPTGLGNIVPQTASGGRRRATFTITPDLPNTGGIFLILNSFPAGDPPKNITCYVVGADKTKAFTPTRRAFSSGFQVHRFMDFTNVNGNAVWPGNTQYGWADREQPGSIAGSPDGMNKELMCAVVNELGGDLWLNLPMYWKDDYYLNIVPLIDQNLAPDRKIYLELGNEDTNFTLNGGVTKEALLRHYVLRTGETRLGDGAGGVGQACKELGYESNRVFNMMRPTLSNFASRCVVVNACFSNNFEYGIKKNEGFLDYDMVTGNAIYVIPDIDTVGKTLTQIKDAWLANMNVTLDYMTIMRDIARADGKRFGFYEVGTDWRKTSTNNAQLANFQKSDEYQDCMFQMWNRLRLEFGDVAIQYWDIGGFGGSLSWGLKEHDLAPTQKGYDGIMAVKALVTA